MPERSGQKSIKNANKPVLYGKYLLDRVILILNSCVNITDVYKSPFKNARKY